MIVTLTHLHTNMPHLVFTPLDVVWGMVGFVILWILLYRKVRAISIRSIERKHRALRQQSIDRFYR